VYDQVLNSASGFEGDGDLDANGCSDIHPDEIQPVFEEVLQENFFAKIVKEAAELIREKIVDGAAELIREEIADKTRLSGMDTGTIFKD
jgi:hypothetical protein